MGEIQWPMTAAPMTSEINSYFVSVPGKQCGARASPPVQLGDAKRAFGSHFCFVLRNTGWPQDPHQIGVLSTAQAGKQLLRSPG